MIAQTGYLDSLTPQEKEILEKVKQYLKDTHGITSKKVWNHWMILRFCRGRKFDFPKIIEMINKYLVWAKQIEIEKVGEIDISKYDLLKSLYNHGYYNTDRTGRPIYIEEVRKMKTTELFQKYTDDELTHYFIQSYQRLSHVIYPECSRVAGRRIDTNVTILELKDVNVLSLFSGKIKAFLKIASDIGQDYYPESLGSMYVLHAGFLFSGIWMIVKGWIDVKTQKKINIISGKGWKELAEVIDPVNLPDFLGGSCKRELKEDFGPWSEELHASYQNKSVFHRDREMVHNYYWDNEEKETDKVQKYEE